MILWFNQTLFRFMQYNSNHELMIRWLLASFNSILLTDMYTTPTFLSDWSVCIYSRQPNRQKKFWIKLHCGWYNISSLSLEWIHNLFGSFKSITFSFICMEIDFFLYFLIMGIWATTILLCVHALYWNPNICYNFHYFHFY